MFLSQPPSRGRRFARLLHHPSFVTPDPIRGPCRHPGPDPGPWLPMPPQRVKSRLNRRSCRARGPGRRLGAWTPAVDVMNCHVFVMRPSRDRKSAHLLRFPLSVMPGLVPGISIGAIAAAEMDARNESGHDGGGMTGGGPWRRARALRPASPPVRGEGRLRSCVPPSGQRAVQGCPCFARHRAGARAGPRAGVSRRRGSRA